MIRVLQKIGDSKIQRYPIKNLLTSNSISKNIAIADISHPKKKPENCRKMWRISYKNSSNQWWSNVASEAKRKRRWPAKVVTTMVGTAFSVSHGEK